MRVASRLSSEEFYILAVEPRVTAFKSLDVKEKPFHEGVEGQLV